MHHVLAIIDWGEVGAISGVIAVLFAAAAYGGRAVNMIMKQRRKPREQQKALNEAMTAQLTRIDTNVNKITETLVGRPPTPWEPKPPPGLVKIVINHSEILEKLMPNGGNSNNPGDLLLRLAENAGVVMDHGQLDTDDH